MKIMDILQYLQQNGNEVKYDGDKDIEIDKFCTLDDMQSNGIAWIKNIAKDETYEFTEITNSVIVANAKVSCNNDKIGFIICSNPKVIFFTILNHFFAEQNTHEYLGKNTVIGDNVVIGENVTIGNNCSIVGDIQIGNNSIISDNVVIKNQVRIGQNCVIQALSVIGEDGFGYFDKSDNQKEMIRHHGGVIIGDNVFIGTHVNIARGTLSNTIIEDGVKIAPSTHIGHNNHIEKNSTIICSQLYGSVHVSENAYIVGSIIRNQCSVGENTMVGMGSVVTKNLEKNKVAIGIPAKVIYEK